MVSNKKPQAKNVTSKLPRNLKPFFDEMDLIDRFGLRLVEDSQGLSGFELLSQLLAQKFDEGIDYFLLSGSSTENPLHCVIARVAGRVKKEPEYEPCPRVEQEHAQVLHEKHPILINANLAEGTSSTLLVPMMAGQQVVGIIHLQSAQGDGLTEQSIYFVNGLAQVLAPALLELPKPYRLNEVYDLMVEAWGSAVDQHEGEMEGHCLRVADLTRRFALRIGVRGERLTALWRGAMLHDLGKMGISDTILFKESTLDLKEWEEMRRHPTFAYDILRRAPFLRDSLDIPYCHHEKWDGSGYPRGLRGEEIPLVARIYALVDVWDALLSDRPFRKAWKRETAVEFLRNNLGSHFDPVLGAEFLKLIDEEGLG